MNRLQAEIRSRETLSADLCRSLYRLYDRYYDGSDEARFIHDLQDKDYVILLWGRQRRLRGFSTLAIMDYTFRGQKQRALFSGDTVIHHDYWGEQVLPRAWCRFAGSVKRRAPAMPLYWFLIVKGHRTYRYLRVFAKRYYPSWRFTTPEDIQALMDHLAVIRFGSAYQAALGVVRFPVSRDYLRPRWAGIGSENNHHHPDIRYFLKRNPGYAGGDELVCLTELASDNLRRHALTAFREGLDHESLV